MKTDKIVLQRFEELETKAKKINENRIFDFQSNEGNSYYKVDSPLFQAWATSALSLLQRVFGQDSIHFQHLNEHYQGFDGYESDFCECRAILVSAREDYAGGYLFSTRGLIQAEVFDDVLEQATELLSAGYKDPACVVVGVALESTLKELCSRNSISFGKLDRMNADLCKAGVYNRGVQKQITAWADRRNAAAHGEWNTYKDLDVEDMIRGVYRLVAEYL